MSVLQHVLQTYVETQLEAQTYSVTPRESENLREGLFKNKQYVAGERWSHCFHENENQ